MGCPGRTDCYESLSGCCQNSWAQQTLRKVDMNWSSSFTLGCVFMKLLLSKQASASAYFCSAQYGMTTDLMLLKLFN